MAERGDERDCGGYTRRYHDEQWDLIITDSGEYYWRDKENHVTYECDSSLIGTVVWDQLGDEVDMFDDEDEDDEEDNGDEEEEGKSEDDDEEKDDSDDDDD